MVKRVLLASPRGYCAGVERAIEAVEQTLEQRDSPVYVRHEIVHNRYVVNELEQRGAIFVDEIAEIPDDNTVIFSAHGVAPTVKEEAASRGLAAIDATCPLVTKVHQEAKRYVREGYHILLVGHEGHEEVIGTAGEVPDDVTIVDGPDHAREVEVPDGPLAWLSQTTLSVDETLETVAVLRDRFPELVDPPSDDICYATQNRQSAVKRIASDSDLLIVVGSANSSNSVRLVEVGLQAGAARAIRVDGTGELEPGLLDGVATVGLTSGASVPDVLVMEVLDWLSGYGFEDVVTVEDSKETLTFALPKELRKRR